MKTLRSTLIIFIFFFSLMSSAQYGQSDWKDRDQWMSVYDLFNLADLGAGDTAGDVGCHEGYLSVHLARTVGKEGNVYAVDVRDDRLERLKKNLKRRSIENVNVILGDYDNPKLPLNKLDVVFVVDTYHEMDAHEKILAHIKSSLKAGGRIVILEKLKKRVIGKTRSQQVEAHSLSMNYVKNELKIAGFELLREVENFGNWERDFEKTMWVVVARKPGK